MGCDTNCCGFRLFPGCFQGFFRPQSDLTEKMEIKSIAGKPEDLGKQ